MVAAIVNVPHELSANALTTTTPRPASAITRIIKTAIEVIIPLNELISALAISASDFPSCLTEAVKITTSCTAPAITAPTNIQMKPGINPN